MNLFKSTVAVFSIGLIFVSSVASAQISTLMQQTLQSEGRQFTLLRIEIPPMSGNNNPESGHRHPGDTVVYVESGTVTNQMNNEAPVEYKAGDFWYEGPGELHAQFRNNDPEETAVVIVFMLNDHDEPLTYR